MTAAVNYGVIVPADQKPAELVEFAVEIEALGYSTLFHADERFFRDVYTLLGPVANATTTLELGPLTADPYSRHPAVQAMSIATLAEMSAGRAVLGIGPGSSGFHTIGIERSHVSTRLREAIELIRLLLISTDNVTYRGETTSFINDRLGFGPIPRVPIEIGTRGPRLLRLAGTVADGVIIGGYCSRPTVEWALEKIDAGLASAGRSKAALGVSVMVYAAVSDNASEARDAARWGTLVALWSSLGHLDDLPLGAPVPDDLIHYMETTQKSFHPEAMEPGMKLIPDSLLEPLSLAGTPDDCIRQLTDLLGADGGGRTSRIILLPRPTAAQQPIDVVRRFAAEVIPFVEP